MTPSLCTVAWTLANACRLVWETVKHDPSSLA